ncbi:MAG: biotin transporter BioY [Candidatus Pelagibacter sp.]
MKIPFYPVPMTMQTFVVILLGMSLGYKLGLATIILYIFEGIIGIPVFSNSPEKGVGDNLFYRSYDGISFRFYSCCLYIWQT